MFPLRSLLFNRHTTHGTFDSAFSRRKELRMYGDGLRQTVFLQVQLQTAHGDARQLQVHGSGMCCKRQTIRVPIQFGRSHEKASEPAEASMRGLPEEILRVEISTEGAHEHTETHKTRKC